MPFNYLFNYHFDKPSIFANYVSQLWKEGSAQLNNPMNIVCNNP